MTHKLEPLKFVLSKILKAHLKKYLNIIQYKISLDCFVQSSKYLKNSKYKNVNTFKNIFFFVMFYEKIILKFFTTLLYILWI